MNKLLKNIISFSLKNKYFILFATGVLIVTGVITFRNMPIEAFPDVTNTEIDIITQWTGRSAEEVEKHITIPLEIALNPVQQKVSLRSTSIFGLSYLKIIFDDNVKDPQARMQVMSLINNATLPPNITPVIQPPTGPTGEIFRYTLKSTFRDVRELKRIQDWVIDRKLRAVPGVGDLNSFGGKTKTYEIKVNPGKLATMGLTPLDVYTAVQNTNINIGGDMIIENDEAYAVRGIGLINDINEINNIVIQNNNGVPLLVKDVATVEISNLPRLGWITRSDAIKGANENRKVTNQDDVVECIVVMRKGENPSEVVKGVEKEIEKLNSEVLPADTKIVPYYNRSDLISYATHTVLHNLIEGMLLVIVLVSLFLFDWRTTLIVGIIIPISLLFAFICLRMMGMTANLLSMGAIDFGIIIDGAVVMVEGMFVALNSKAKEVGMAKFNKLSKMGLFKIVGTKMGKAIFFSKAIIISCLIPIFAFQKVEGKMFSPLAYTLGFALLGALITTLTLVPVLASMMLNKNVHEKHNPLERFINRIMLGGFEYCFKRRKAVLIISGIIIAIGLSCFKFLGSEFLPELNEGAIWLRVQLPYSASLPKGVEVAVQTRNILMKFPQVQCVVSQTGRPDDGTDVTGFYNNEFDVIMYPESEWNPKISKDELIEQMNKKLAVIPGVNLNFSQPIMDNVEEAVSGVKGSICVKIFGDDLEYMEKKLNEVYNIMKDIRGVGDLGVIQNIGQPEIDVDLSQEKMAIYGVTTANANSVLAMAIGGQAASTLYEGIETYDIRVRLPEEFRKNEEDIGNLLVPTMSGSKVPIKELATITRKTGACLIFRENNERYSALKFSAVGRDMGSTVAEAQKEVNKKVTLKRGYKMVWQGDFENKVRAEKRLAQVVPLSLLLIFLLLFGMFGNLRDSGLVFLNIPFAIVGGILSLLITGTDFSISAGIGFIAVSGVCILFGIILITIFKENLDKLRKEPDFSIYTAIKSGVNEKIRPVLMTALMAAIGLCPAALSHGIGSESSRPLARVVIGGILFAMMYSLWVFPLIFNWVYRKTEKKHIEKTEK